MEVNDLKEWTMLAGSVSSYQSEELLILFLYLVPLAHHKMWNYHGNFSLCIGCDKLLTTLKSATINSCNPNDNEHAHRYCHFQLILRRVNDWSKCYEGQLMSISKVSSYSMRIHSSLSTCLYEQNMERKRWTQCISSQSPKLPIND